MKRKLKLINFSLFSLFLFFFSFNLFIIASNSTILYVSPNGNGTNCTENSPCSLSQAINSSQNNDQLILSNGTYDIDSTMIIESKNISLNGTTGTKLTSSIQLPLLKISNSSISMNDLEFTNCTSTIVGMNSGIAYFDNCSFLTNRILRNNNLLNLINVIMINSEFIGNFVNSTMIQIEENAYFDNCHFSNNNSTLTIISISNGTMSNSLFEENTGIYAGVIKSTNITLFNSTFTRNISKKSYGGVIYADIAIVEKCTFESNSVLFNGGAIYSMNQIQVNNCTFKRNIAQYNGGSIYLYSRSALQSTISNCLFDRNRDISNNGQGGALYLYTSSPITLINNTFSYNVNNDGSGAGAFIHGNTTIDNCLFEHNFAANGGALNIACITCSIQIINCQFKSNMAKNFGSSINLGSIIQMNITNCTFHSENGESIIYNEYGENLFINDCSFENNIGTAVYSHGDQLIIQQSFFTLNSATDSVLSGGAIYLNGSSLILQENIFIGNRALNGGAVYISSRSTSSIQIINNIFQSNVAESGAAIFIMNPNSTTSTIISNLQSNLFINNIASYQGGALYLNDINNITIIDCHFQSNQISSSNYPNEVFGGVIYMNYGNLTITNSTFINSQIHSLRSLGGVIFYGGENDENDVIELNNVIFNSNSAISPSSSFGGVIFTGYSVQISANNCTFINNTAKFGGVWGIGQLNSTNQLNQLSNQTFINNTATVSGSIIYVIKNLLNENLTCPQLNNQSIDNFALFGMICSSIPATLQLVEEIPNNVWQGMNFEANLALFDWFNQITYNPSYLVTISSTPSIGFSTQGQLATISVNSSGIYSYSQLTLQQPINSISILSFIANTTVGDSLLTLNIEVRTINCRPGYITTNTSELNLPLCTQCPNNQYSFNGLNCMDCPYSYLINSTLQCMSYSMNDQYQMIISSGYSPNYMINPSKLIDNPLYNSSGSINCLLSSNSSSLEWTVNCNQCNNQNNQSNDQYCYCNQGYTNQLCSECECNSIDDCYYIDNQQCIKCFHFYSDLSDNLIQTLLVIMIIIFLIFTIVLMFIVPRSTWLWMIGLLVIVIIYGLISDSWFFTGFLLMILILYLVAGRRFPIRFTGSLLFYIQSTSALIPLISWPHFIQPLIRSIGELNLNISYVGCYWPTILSNPLIIFILFNLIPLIIILLILIVIMIESTIGLIPIVKKIRNIYDRLIESIDLNGKSKIANISEDELYNLARYSSLNSEILNEEDNESIVDRIRRIISSVVIFVYFPITKTNLAVYRCENGYMKEYQWIGCYSEEYWLFISIGSLMIIGFVIGVPLIIGSLMIYYRYFKSEEEQRKVEVLSRGYRKQMSMYLIVDLLKKLLIAIIISLIDYGIYYQLLVVSLLGLFVFLQGYLKPFSSLTLNLVDFIAEISVLASFVFSTFIIYNAPGFFNQEYEFIQYIILGLNSIVILLYLICAIESNIILRSINWIKSKIGRNSKDDDDLIY